LLRNLSAGGNSCKTSLFFHLALGLQFAPAECVHPVQNLDIVKNLRSTFNHDLPLTTISYVLRSEGSADAHYLCRMVEGRLWPEYFAKKILSKHQGVFDYHCNENYGAIRQWSG